MQRSSNSYLLLVYTTQVNSAFRAIWLVPQSRHIKWYSLPGGFRRKKKIVLYILKQLFAEVEVNSGGYLPRRSGSVNIHRYSPPLRRIIVNYTNHKNYTISTTLAPDPGKTWTAQCQTCFVVMNPLKRGGCRAFRLAVSLLYLKRDNMAHTREHHGYFYIQTQACNDITSCVAWNRFFKTNPIRLTKDNQYRSH